MADQEDEGLSVEEEIEVEDLLDDEDPADEESPEAVEAKVEAAAAAKAKAKPAAPETSELEQLREKNAQLSGWAGRTRHENQALRERLERGETRMQRLMEAIARHQGIDPADLDKPPEEKIPDPDTDPVGSIVAQLRKELAGFKGELTAKADEAAAKQDIDTRIQEVQGYHEADIARFEQSHPDYDAAEGFLIDAVTSAQERALKISHPRAPESWVKEQANAAVMDIIARHQLQYHHERASLAEYVYQRAIEEGYQPGNGHAPAKRKSPAAGLAERRRAAGTSLAAASGSPGTGGKKIEALADMSDDEFADLMDAAEDKTGKAGAGWKRVTAQLAAR